MSNVPFDTMKLADRLQVGGFSAEQAKATSSALADALADGVSATIHSSKSDTGSLKTEMNVVKWMLGFVLAFEVAIFLKLFVH